MSLDGGGIAAILGGVALLIGALAAAYSTVVATNRIKEMAPMVTDTKAIAEDTNRMAGQIDRAVNGQPPGATTMVSQVQDLHSREFPVVEENGDAALIALVRQMALDIAELKEGQAYLRPPEAV